MSIFHLYFETTAKHGMDCLEIWSWRKIPTQAYFLFIFQKIQGTITLTPLSETKSVFKRHREPFCQKQRGREGDMELAIRKKPTNFESRFTWEVKNSVKNRQCSIKPLFRQEKGEVFFYSHSAGVGLLVFKFCLMFIIRAAQFRNAFNRNASHSGSRSFRSHVQHWSQRFKLCTVPMLGH